MGWGRRRQEDQELGREGHLFLVGAKRQLPFQKSRISNKSSANDIEIFTNRYWFISFNHNMPVMERVQFWSWLLHQLQSASCLNTCPISVQWWIQKENANPRVDVFGGDCWRLLTSKLKLFRVISGDSGSEVSEEAWKIERVDVWIPGQSSESGLVKLYLNTSQHQELPSAGMLHWWLDWIDRSMIWRRPCSRRTKRWAWRRDMSLGWIGWHEGITCGEAFRGISLLRGSLRGEARMQFTKSFRLSMQPGCLCSWCIPPSYPTWFS